MKTKRWQSFLFFAGLVLISNGCATHALWSDSRFARFQEPAKPANLSVFQSPQTSDLLIQYDETQEDSPSRHRRAYWLEQNQEPGRNPHKPRFLPPETAQGLTPVPVFTSITNAPPELPLFVVLAENGQDFTLYAQTKVLGGYELPVYRSGSDRTTLILLTPLTVIGDAILVGAAAAIICAPYYWASLNDCAH